MKRTLLYFGSFNPIHVGHLVIANHVIASGITDELWFVVSPQNPFKPADALASAADRVGMVRLALEKAGLSERISVSDTELHLSVPSYTIQTLEALWAAHPDRKFSILMGSDNFHYIHQWKEAERILEACEIVIYERPGHPIPEGNLHNIKRLEEAPVLEIGSTRLREWLAEGRYIPAMLPAGVYQYIVEHGLYHHKSH